MSTDDRAARPRPDPRPRRARRRHRPGREHRRRRPPQRSSRRRRDATPTPARAAAGPATGSCQRRQRRGRHDRLRRPRPGRRRPRHEPPPARGWPRSPPPPATGPTRSPLIADAALPAHRPGERLDDTLRRARRHRRRGARPVRPTPPAALADVVAHYRDRYGERCWREQFWQRQLRIAALRFRHPRFYGLSPCEADPAPARARGGAAVLGAARRAPPDRGQRFDRCRPSTTTAVRGDVDSSRVSFNTDSEKDPGTGSRGRARPGTTRTGSTARRILRTRAATRAGDVGDRLRRGPGGARPGCPGRRVTGVDAAPTLLRAAAAAHPDGRYLLADAAASRSEMRRSIWWSPTTR